MVSDGQNWSTEAMRNSAEAWSLADDVCLRDFLETFGAKLDENIRQVLDSLGKLEDRIEASAINLGNVTNRLGLLSSTQFVESRVAEDDDSPVHFEENNSEVKQDPNSEEVFCAKVGWALNNGNSFIESAFVTVDFDQSDSEDDDVLQDLEPVYESRSAYHLRRLPHVIGTQKFLTETNVGLSSSSDEKEEPSALSDSEDSENEDHHQVLKIDSVPEQVSDYSISDEDSDDELEFQNPKTVPKQPQNDSRVLSNYEHENPLDDRYRNESGGPKASFADELASKIGGSKLPVHKVDSKPSRGLFSSDSDEDDGIFSAPPVASKRESNPKIENAPPIKPRVSTPTRSPKGDEKSKASNPLMDPRQSPLVNQSKPSKNEKSRPMAIQANQPPSSEKPKKEQSIFSTDSSTDSEEHPTVTVAPPPSKVMQKLPSSNEANRVEGKVVTQNIAPRSSKLFASDSDDDELFTPKTKTSTNSAVRKTSDGVAKPLPKGTVLEPVPVKASEPPEKENIPRKKASIFDDSSSEDEIDELFKAVSRPTRTQMPTPKKNRSEETKMAPNRPTIFSDSDSDEITTPDLPVVQSSSARGTKPDDHVTETKPEVLGSSSSRTPTNLSEDNNRDQRKNRPFDSDTPKTDDSSYEQSVVKNAATDHETSANDDVDGNVMSAKSAQFKDILNAKMAKGPKLFGKRKKSVNLVSEDTGTSSENLDRQQPLQVQSHQDVSSVENIAPMKSSTSDSKQILREPHQPIDSEDSVLKEVKVLESLTKARATRPPNRRGPSRKILREAAQDTSDGPYNSLTVSDSRTETSEYEDSSLPSSFQPQSLLDSKKPKESTSYKQHGSEAQKEVSKSQPTSSVPKTESNNDDDDDDDIFGPPPMPDTIKSARDPLFGTPSSDEDDLFSSNKGSQPKKSTTASSLFDDLDSDDDLFA